MKFVLVLFVAVAVLVAVQAKPCDKPEKPEDAGKKPDPKTAQDKIPEPKIPDTKAPDGANDDDGEATAVSIAEAKGKKATAIAISSAE